MGTWSEMGTSRSWAGVGVVEAKEGEEAKGLLVTEREDMVGEGGGQRGGSVVVVGEEGGNARR
jgi:hypothetical protein